MDKINFDERDVKRARPSITFPLRVIRHINVKPEEEGEKLMHFNIPSSIKIQASRTAELNVLSRSVLKETLKQFARKARSGVERGEGNPWRFSPQNRQNVHAGD